MAAAYLLRAAIVLPLVACGPTLAADAEPSAWAIGTWSNQPADIGTMATTSSIGHFIVDEDGTLHAVSFECESAEVSVLGEYAWRTEHAAAIEILNYDDEEPTFFVFRAACEQFEGREAAYLVHELDGRELFTADHQYVRGEVCVGEVERWGGCALSWCGGEPPPAWPCD